MSTINDIAASVGLTNPAKRMLTRDEQVAKYMKLARSAMLNAQSSAEWSRGRLRAAESITAGSAPHRRLLGDAARWSLDSEQSSRDAQRYIDIAREASLAPESATFEDL